jgi:hypothetical protein
LIGYRTPADSRFVAKGIRDLFIAAIESINAQIDR